MRQQIEERIEVLRKILAERNDALTKRKAAAQVAVVERDYVVGAIAELVYLLEQPTAEPQEGVTGRIPASQE